MICSFLKFYEQDQKDKPQNPVCIFWQQSIYKAFDHLASVKTSLKALYKFALLGFSLSPQSQLLMEVMVNNAGHLKNTD